MKKLKPKEKISLKEFMSKTSMQFTKDEILEWFMRHKDNAYHYTYLTKEFGIGRSQLFYYLKQLIFNKDVLQKRGYYALNIQKMEKDES